MMNIQIFIWIFWSCRKELDKKGKVNQDRVALWLATCAWKPKILGPGPAASSVQYGRSELMSKFSWSAWKW